MSRIREQWRGALAAVIQPLAALAAALALGWIVVAVSGYDPREAFGVFLRHAFLTRNGILETVERAIPLTFTGLAVAVAFRSGVFNIGVEGQMYMGALAGFWVAYAFSLPPVLHPVLAILAGAAAGALWALPPAVARAVWKADEVVTTLMTNYVAILFTSYMVAVPFKDTTAGAQQTWPIQETAHLLRFLPPSRVHLGLFLALAMAGVVYLMLFRTAGGYELRLLGQNPLFAEYAGIDVRRAVVRAMAWSGALGGVAGAVEVLGIHLRLIDLFSPGYGFDGIVVSLLARNHPLAVLLSAFLFGGLRTGAAYMDRLTDVPRELNDALQGLLIFMLAAEGLLHFARRSPGLRERLGALLRRRPAGEGAAR